MGRYWPWAIAEYVRSAIRKICGHRYGCCDNVFKPCGRCRYGKE